MDSFPGPNTSLACKGADKVKDAAKDVASDAFKSIVESFSESAAEIVKALATGWLHIDSPTLKDTSGPVQFMFQNTMWLTAWVAVLSLLIAAGRMAWERRADPGREAGLALVRLILASSAMVAGSNLLLKAGDEYSVWIVNRATHCEAGGASKACVENFTERIAKLTLLSAAKGPMLALILIMSLLLILSSLAQIVMMLTRNAMVIILVGTLPLAAAASSTAAGKAWFQKSAGWMLAFFLFKPTAATIYGAAFTALGTEDDTDIMTMSAGLTMMIMAAVALPILMRFFDPAVAALGQGRGGGGLAGVAQSVASGAIALKTGGASKAAMGAKGAAGGGSPGQGGAPGSGQPGSPKPGAGPTPPGGKDGGTNSGNSGAGQPTGGQTNGKPPGGAPASGGPSGGSASSGATPPPAGSTAQGGPGSAPVPPARNSRDRSEEGPRGSRE
ncbi:hypothetical protein [Streptomyces alboflavus]|uniref:hypothetical protein n=1 Tax=Streptomyces alboflavus TaxID=67267 RepID=UPI000F65673C|nr:hypothetical protein [Streptomyces alboflavus]